MKTVDDFLEYLRYEPETGDFYWIKVNTNTIKVGDKAGTLDKSNGYIKISIFGRKYYAHRLAFFLINGYFPPQVDHDNGDRSDNRSINLVGATNQRNSMNSKKRINNRSGFGGVYWASREQKWVVEAIVDGIKHYIGRFSDKDKAIEARRQFNLMHGFSERHGI